MYVVFFSLFGFAADDITFIADEITYSENGAELNATGNVTVKYQNYTLTTPGLSYNRNTGAIVAINPIKIKAGKELSIFAESAELNDQFKKILASKARAIIENQFSVEAESMERLNSGGTVFYSSFGTACKVCPASPTPLWQINASKITHDPESKRLNFYNAWLEFLDIPIIYTPFLRIPEPGTRRATGLLTPKILTSDLLGVGIKQPYYLTISDYSDLTISALKTTKTNLLLETEYRHIFNSGSLNISGAGIPNNANNVLDGYFNIKSKFNFLQNSKISLDATAVSDSGFLGRYGYDDTDRLTSVLSLNTQSKSNFSEASATYFTSLRDSGQSEYIVAPNFYSRSFARSKKMNSSYGATISLVGLTRPNPKINSIRVNGTFDLRTDNYLNNGLYLKGITELSSNFYRIKQNLGEIEYKKTIHPTFAAEINLPMYRKDDKDFKVIKPTLQFVYTPELLINDNIYFFDSQQVNLDQTSLFSLNRFSGLDQQEKGFRLNSGIEYSVFRKDEFSYDLSLGQIFRRATSDQFSIDSSLSGLRSDILISGNIDYAVLMKVHAQQLYNENFVLKEAETSLNFYQDEGNVSIGLLFLEADSDAGRPDQLKELILGMDASLNEHWIADLDLRRNLNQNENINAAIGFLFQNECADIRLEFSKRFTETNALPADTRVELSFDLNGTGTGQNKLTKSNCVKLN